MWSEIEVTGRAAHGSRPHLGVDAIVKAGPDPHRARRARRGARRAHASAARARLGARVGDHAAARSCRATRRAAWSGSSGARCRARTPGDVEAELDALLDRCRAADPALAAEHRTLLVREPFEVRRGRGDRRAACAPRAADVLGAPPAVDRRELLGRRGVHRRRRHPDGDVRARGRGRARRRGVGEPVLDRGGRPRSSSPSPSGCARELPRQPRRRPAAVPAPATDAAAFHAALPGYRPTPLRPLPGARRRARRRRRRRSRTSPTGSGCRRSRCSARRGRSSARCASARRPDTLVAASAGNHGRAVAHVARRARPALPRLPAGAGRRPRGARRSPPRAPRSSSSTATTRTRSRAPRRTAAADPVASRSPTSATPAPRAGSIDGYATLFAEAAEQGDARLVLVPVGVGLARRGGGALRRPPGAHGHRRRAGHRRVPHRVAGRGTPDRGADAGHDDGGPGLRRGLPGGVADAARRRSTAR